MLSLRHVLRDGRRSVKIDWAIRDLVIKLAVQMKKEGYSDREVLTIKEYLKRKIDEDIAHTLILFKAREMFVKAGFQVVLTDMRNEMFDMVVFKPGRAFLVEVKAGPPPWGGNNPKEYDMYFASSLYNILYVWYPRRELRNEVREHELYCTTINNVNSVFQNGKYIITASKKWKLKDYIQSYSR